MPIHIEKRSFWSFWLVFSQVVIIFLLLIKRKHFFHMIEFILQSISSCDEQKIYKCNLFTTMCWNVLVFLTDIAFCCFSDEVKKFCISKKAKSILISILLLLAQLEIHLHPLLLVVRLFFMYHEGSYE